MICDDHAWIDSVGVSRSIPNIFETCKHIFVFFPRLGGLQKTISCQLKQVSTKIQMSPSSGNLLHSYLQMAIEIV